MWNLTQEKKDNLCKNRDDRNQELKNLQALSIKTMWRKDLDDFITKLDEVEKKENEDLAEAAANAAKMKKTAGKKGKGIKMEALPSAHAIRVDPVIADDLKAKASKAVAAKERKDKGEDKPKKVKKEVDEEIDEFDLMASDKALNKSLSQKLGTPTKEKKKHAPKTSPGAKKGEKKKNPWSDSDASHYIEPTPPKKKPAPTKKKIVAKSFDSDSDSDKPNGNGNGHAMNGDSDSDDEPVKKKPAAKKAAKK